MKRQICDPRHAMDYPKLDDDLVVIWFGNEHRWPDARRETRFLSDRRDSLRGYALFSPFPEQAITFPDVEAASKFVEEMNALRPAPYHAIQISTVAEMKVARGYKPPPAPEEVPGLEM